MVKLFGIPTRNHFSRAGSLAAIAVSLAYAGTAMAQTAPVEEDPEATSDTGLVVTGSRIEKNGFDQPTPTTIIGEAELAEGARTNIQQVLVDQPQVRPTTVPQNSNGNVNNSGSAPVDLRGLGNLRTLTLLNGRRFIGDNNLNYVPFNLVSRVEIVTGGASAAYGSGAVAGVVNIILNEQLSGFNVGAQTGISGLGDGFRYGFDGSFGTSFADGRGHFMIGAEYVNDEGIGPDGRLSRPFLGAGAVRVNPTSTTDLTTRLVEDVNFGNTAIPGLIRTGVLAGQVFNADGTLRNFRGGTQIGSAQFNGTMIGGEDGTTTYDNIYLNTPVERATAYARASFEIGDAKIWVDGSYGRAESNYPFLYVFSDVFTVQSTNAFLSQAIRDRLAAAGQTSFTLARYFSDEYTMGLESLRQSYEGAIGIDGSFGGGAFKYRAHYSHGESTRDESLTNSRLTARYNNALESVLVGGVPTCVINADAITTNNDPACSPINPFGPNNVSDAAIAYTTGTQSRSTLTYLDSAGAQLQADLFRAPGGTVTAVVGAEWRSERQRQSISSTDPIGQFSLPVLSYGLNGSFSVKEAYGELAVPLFDFTDTVKVDLNGAARYSDYSNTGGIWSWKVGGTVRLFNDLLLRGLRSRDIRSPSIDPELFTPQAIGIQNLGQDFQSAQFASTPGYVPNPTNIRVITGGNPVLNPETAKTLTFGATYSPSFVPGLRLSADYYDIRIDGAIATLGTSATTQACSLGNAGACANIVRDPTTNTITQIFVYYQNLQSLTTRGYDFEVAYRRSLADLGINAPGSLSLRGLVNYNLRNITDTGTAVTTNTGLGGRVRGRVSLSYQTEEAGLDIRLRYISGGPTSNTNAVVTNPTTGVTTGSLSRTLDAYTYVDLGAQFRVAKQFSMFLNVNNLFDKTAPLETQQSGTYDHVGRYFSAGARVKF
jgi:outer membrane receptor protein involved in Fe transport